MTKLNEALKIERPKLVQLWKLKYKKNLSIVLSHSKTSSACRFFLLDRPTEEFKWSGPGRETEELKFDIQRTFS